MDGVRLAGPGAVPRGAARRFALPPPWRNPRFRVHGSSGTTVGLWRARASSLADVGHGLSSTRRQQQMIFIEGQTIVHPHHGPARVQSITTRTIRKVESRYLILEIKETNLIVGVPMDQAQSVGLRAVFNQAEVERLFEVFRAPSDPEEEQWARRTKDAQENLRTGDIYAAAAVVRNLIRRRSRSHLSPMEKSMLKEAQKPLVTEIGLSLGISADQAETLLETQVVLGEDQHEDIPEVDESPLQQTAPR